MKKNSRLLKGLFALIATVAMMAQGMAFEPEGTTLEQAAAKAKAENKLIFLDCYTQWCGPCKKMARDVFPQETVGAFMNPRYINIKIDMESAYGAPLAKKLQIQAYPTFVIFNADAQEIGRFLGGSEAESFIKNVEEKSKDNSSAEPAAALEERRPRPAVPEGLPADAHRCLQGRRGQPRGRGHPRMARRRPSLPTAPCA